MYYFLLLSLLSLRFGASFTRHFIHTQRISPWVKCISGSGEGEGVGKKEADQKTDLAEKLITSVLLGDDGADADLATESVMDQYIEKTVTKMIGEPSKSTVDPTEKFKEIYAVTITAAVI